MIRTIIALAAISTATAFAPLKTSSSSSIRLKAMEPAVEDVETTAVEEPTLAPPEPVRPQRLKAKWFPIGNVLAPSALDGTLAGDAGFDPAGFAKDKNTLLWMREAEIKHARLAMLAAVGWPLSELWHKSIAATFGLESILAGKSGSLAPSLLNGGLNSVYASGMLMMSLIFTAALEGGAMNKGELFLGADKSDSYKPGDFGFDPLNLKNVRGDVKIMEENEIKNGRLAMIAISFYAFSEFFTKVPVVEQTPFLF